MPMKNSKRIIIEVEPEYHEIVKNQAKKLNMTIKAYILYLINNEITKREELKKC